MKLKEFVTVQERLAEIFPESSYTANISDASETITVKFVIYEAITSEQLKQLFLIGEPELKRSGKGIRVLLVIDKKTLDDRPTEYGKVLDKAKKYDALDLAVSKFYPEDHDGVPQETGDLCDIGEKVCSMLGYM